MKPTLGIEQSLHRRILQSVIFSSKFPLFVIEAHYNTPARKNALLYLIRLIELY